MTAPRVVFPAALATLLALGTLAGCRGATEARPAPLLVVGVDGAERRVLETLWQRGELPVLRKLADEGTLLPLDTDYGISPVIWTTIATGMPPAEHGITDFAVATEHGDVPVSSEVRRRPALWEMTSRVGRPTAVLGWWATWPAEAIRGVVVSDRIESEVGRTFSPPERAPDLERWLATARAGGLAFGGNAASELRDRVVTQAARELIRGDFRLLLVYYRSADLASHDYWHLFAPEDFPDGPPPGARTSPTPDPVADSYRAIDAAIGEILAAAPPATSVLVISDHGFRAERRESLQLLLDLDQVLRRLGWQRARHGGEVDPARSRAWVYASPTYKKVKLVRFADGPDRPTVEELGELLRRASFDGGRPAFAVREPDAEERQRGADAVVQVVAANASPRLFIDGVERREAILHFGRITGGHGVHTRGVLLASGPIFQRGEIDARVSIHDIAPSVLYALGLPVAEDFPGGPALKLFTDGFRNRHPPRKIGSWGRRETGGSVESADDKRLLEELGALGYLD